MTRPLRLPPQRKPRMRPKHRGLQRLPLVTVQYSRRKLSRGRLLRLLRLPLLRRPLRVHGPSLLRRCQRPRARLSSTHSHSPWTGTLRNLSISLFQLSSCHKELVDVSDPAGSSREPCEEQSQDAAHRSYWLPLWMTTRFSGFPMAVHFTRSSLAQSGSGLASIWLRPQVAPARLLSRAAKVRRTPRPDAARKVIRFLGHIRHRGRGHKWRSLVAQ